VENHIKVYHPVHIGLDKRTFLTSFYNKELYVPEYNMTRDAKYDKPDYKRTMFYTGISKSINDKKFYSLDHRNMLTPITHDPTFLETITSRSDMSKTLTNFNPGTKLHTVYGIYVTEEFFIKDEIHCDVNSVLNYYTNNKHIEFNDDTIQQFRNDITTHTYPAKNGIRCSNLSLRVTTFIPEDEIIDNGMVYTPELDLVFIHDNTDRDMLHPRSNRYREVVANTTAVTEHKGKNNIISIEVIDNESYTNKPYYIKIGNEVTALKSIKDPTVPSGCVYTHINNSKVVVSMHYNNNEYSKLGLFDTKDGCIANGDTANMLVMKKLEIEHDNIALAGKKLIDDKDKRIEELKVSKDKQDYELRTLETKNLKLDKDIETIQLKMKVETAANANLLLKYEHELKVLKEERKSSTKEAKLRDQKHAQDIAILRATSKKQEEDNIARAIKHSNDMKTLKEQNKKLDNEAIIAKLKAKAEIVAHRRSLVINTMTYMINMYSQLFNIKQSRIKSMLDTNKVYTDMLQSNQKHRHDIDKIKLDHSLKAVNTVATVVNKFI